MLLTLQKLLFRSMGFDLHEVAPGIYTTSKPVPGIALSLSHIVVIDIKLFHNCSQDEIQAVIQHELAHQRLGHHWAWIKAKLLGKATFDLQQRHELAADAAVKQIGLGNHLRNFLIRIKPFAPTDKLYFIDQRIQLLLPASSEATERCVHESTATSDY